jgi:hypothetical protein
MNSLDMDTKLFLQDLTNSIFEKVKRWARIGYKRRNK